MSNTQTEKAQAGADKQVSQGDAVVQVVKDVLKSDYKEGIKVVLTDEQRMAAVELLVIGFTDRRIPRKASPANDEKLKDTKKLEGYCRGLLQNWLVKSPALNGKPKKAKTAPTPAPVPEVKVETKPQESSKSDKEAPVTPIAAKKSAAPMGKK